MKKQLRYALLAFISMIILGLTSFLVYAEDAEMEMRQTEIMYTSRLPEGLVSAHGRLQLRRGYYFNRVSRSRADIVSSFKRNVTGSLECRCRARGGYCQINVTPNAVYCSRYRCGSRCILQINTPEVTIMGGSGYHHMENHNH